MEYCTVIKNKSHEAFVLTWKSIFVLQHILRKDAFCVHIKYVYTYITHIIVYKYLNYIKHKILNR